MKGQRFVSQNASNSIVRIISPDDSVVVVGGGGHAKVVVDAIASVSSSVRGFLDDRADAALASIMGARWLGTIESGAIPADAMIIVALGSNPLRERVTQRLAERAGSEALNVALAHRAAYIARSARLSPGVFVAARAVINPDAEIRHGAIVNTGAIVEHDCVIGEFAHVAPGAVLGGAVRIGARTLVGLGARVLPGVAIAPDCVIGAGAVVIRDVDEAGATLIGVPARRTK